MIATIFILFFSNGEAPPSPSGVAVPAFRTLFVKGR
jgi:hypothetical protein